MDKKTQLHESIMAFLDDYLTNTPLDIIQKEAAVINKLQFTGVSARDYFKNFDKYYLGLDVKIPQNSFIDAKEAQTKNSFYLQKNKKSLLYTSPSDSYWGNSKIKDKGNIFNEFQYHQNPLYSKQLKKYSYV
jgi:hypothetical protein